MLRKIEVAVLSILVCAAFVFAAQRQSLKIVPDPSALGVRAQGDTIRVEWVQLSASGSQDLKPTPDSGYVYYASAPAGGDLSKYTKLASVVADNVPGNFSASARKRVTRFVPARQGGRMGAGAYYAIVAAVSGGDTLYSDYINIMVASADPPAIESPMADLMKGELVKKVSDLAPLFTWKAVPGVPYYHIVLSDVPFIDDGGKVNAGVNIIWQAITPNTRIAYGAPDPSNTITAPPPPLSPGTTYSWMVLNNYGNHPAFTSWDVVSVMSGMAGRFVIDRGRLTAPRAASPAQGSVFKDAARIEFKWTNLDANANSYLVNLFREGTTDEFGMGGMGEFSMSLLAWETTVPRGDRRGADTLSVALDAAGTLTGGWYRWRVYALDSRGAASTDAVSSSSFKYEKADEGRISIKTLEKVGGVDLSVGYVELKSEVVSGPTMAPLLFYTNGAGVLERQFSAGTYRITAVKEGYLTYTSTVTVRGGDVAVVSIPMLRSEAVLYGRVLAASDNSAVNAARVAAVSEWGDSLSATTDGSGSFVLACRAADWYVTVEKPGFRASARRKVTLRIGDNSNFGDVYLTENPFALSGVVRNSAGDPLMGAQVRVLREGVLVNEITSTPQSGAYAFYLDAGTYTLTAEKPGFAMFSRSVVVTGATAQDAVLREGAVLVGGSIVGMSWVAGMNNGAGGYVSAPVASARLVFAEFGAATKPDTFTVASDPVFGKFSVSLPKDKDYNVTVSAAGFASGAASEFNTRGVGGDLFKAYVDTLYALATIKGRVTGVGADVQVDVIVYGADGQIVASGKSVGGVYEVRNIPDGEVTVGAGADGFYTRDSYTIAISKGRLDPNREFYDFEMKEGDKSVRFSVVGYERSGAVKVISPLNRTLAFNNAAGVVAELSGVGAGVYAVEAVPNDDAGLLELSYHRFNVSDDASAHTEPLSFPFTHTAADTAALNGDSVKINKPQVHGNLDPPMRMSRITLFYRSEGSLRFDSITTTNVSSGAPQEFGIKPARDGCNLYYYFRVYLENGDIYGSSKQLFHSYVKPDAHIISRVAVEPGVAGGDTLVMPSSYPAAFVFRAFYSDQFVPVSGSVGTVSWSVLDAGTGEPVVPPGTGMNYTYVTFNAGRDLILRARFEPAGGYVMKAGVSGVVEFPVKVTGKPLKSIDVVRKGDAGPVSNTERAGFRVQAFDDDGKPVTVSPQWGVYPRGAGAMAADGLFTPNPGFVGTAGITVAAGGLTQEYTEPGAASRGQRVYYVFKHNAAGGGDTANTLKGMRVVFGADALKAGMSTNLETAVPELTNHVQRGTEDFRMADSIAFDLTYSDVRAVSGDVTLVFDIPEPLRREAVKGGYEFRVARWFPDSLRWIPIDSARTSVVGGVVTAVLSPEPAGQPVAASSKKSAAQISAAATLAAQARYALVTKTSKTAVALSISPHPFSPYIVPRKEYGSDAKAGTCIRVNVQAPESYVGSVKVRIYNATGKMVWGVEKQNAETGEHRFWWNGRTSGRSGGRISVSEEVWTPDYYESNADKPLCRNGRYYVMVILTDKSNNQRRTMKPLVLMK